MFVACFALIYIKVVGYNFWYTLITHSPSLNDFEIGYNTFPKRKECNLRSLSLGIDCVKLDNFSSLIFHFKTDNIVPISCIHIMSYFNLPEQSSHPSTIKDLQTRAWLQKRFFQSQSLFLHVENNISWHPSSRAQSHRMKKITVQFPNYRT